MLELGCWKGCSLQHSGCSHAGCPWFRPHAPKLQQSAAIRLCEAHRACRAFRGLRLDPVAVPAQDLLAAGITGLQKAINRFDPTRGFKFSTYSHWWIRQTIQRTVIQHGRVIRWAPKTSSLSRDLRSTTACPSSYRKASGPSSPWFE